MANVLYDLGRQAFAAGGLDWVGDDIACVLVDGALYVPNLATDEFLSDIALAARVSTSPNLAGKTNVAGVCDANDVTFSAVTGASCEYLVIYQNTGSAATSRLIAFIDTATGLPLTPTGADEEVQWSDGADKIFKI